jgi:F-type H+-transporting ATPase subunit alpha
MSAGPDIGGGNGRGTLNRPLRDLMQVFEGHSVTLWCRTQLSDEVIDQVRSWVCDAASREVALEVRTNPSMDAGAVLRIGDLGQVVLDPRVMWLDDIRLAATTRSSENDLADAGDVYEYLRDEIERSEPGPRVEQLSETGAIQRMADGVVAVSGLRGVGSQELVEFDGGVLGIAFSVAADHVGCVLLGEDSSIREGAQVRRTGRQLKVPVGEGLCGRVIDPLGRPLDDRGPIVAMAWEPAERPAPGVIERQPVDTSLHTGQKVVDALVPIGRGQRELIVGDRKIGKTTLAVDAILAQRDENVTSVYCAIGQKSSSVRQVVDTLAQNGALERTIIVASLPADPPALRYLTPFTACAIGEYFRDRGGDALVIYDDLSKHAVTYREISALLDRPIGREAYPGDIFYVHARLLERAARLSTELGGGSLTALPIAETLAGDLSSFIPTNLISICDGQIVLDSVAFNEGRRPAMDPGLSVSRVGGSAQRKIMRKIAGRLRIDLAQYEEMARFVKFGAELDEATRSQLARGERARTLLVQDARAPMPLEEELLVLYAAVSGGFDEVRPELVSEAGTELGRWAYLRHPHLMRDLRDATDLTDELERGLSEALAEFVAEHKRRVSETEALTAAAAFGDAEAANV